MSSENTTATTGAQAGDTRDERHACPAGGDDGAARPEPPRSYGAGWAVGGVAVVVALAAVTRFLEQAVPALAEGTALGNVAAAIEYPVYAIALGLLGNVVLTRLGLCDRLEGGFRTEFFIKTGLVLLGASINFAVIVSAAGPARPRRSC